MKGKYPNGLRDAMEKAAIGLTELARLTDSTKQTVGRYRDEERRLPSEWARKAAPVLGTTPSMLMFGSGGDPAETVRELTYHPEDAAVAFTTEAPYEPKTPGALPEIDVRPGAGHGQVGELGVVMLRSGESMAGHRVIREWALPEGFTRNHLEITPGRTLVMEVIGDSMLPTLLPGDRVVVDMSQTNFRADALYVLDDDYGEPSVKRLRRVAYAEPPTLEVISDNPTYGNDRVAADRVRIIGRVCGHMSRK